MSDTDRTITRRHVLRTGGLAAIMAGLLGTTGTTTTTPAAAMAAAGVVVVGAEPIALPTAHAVRVVNYPDLSNDVRAAIEAYEAADTKERAACAALEARLGRDLYMEVMRFVEGPYNERHDAFEDLVLAEMERHLPMVAPVLYMVRQHIYEAHRDHWGRCCVPEVEA